jgi:hypothetical protein
MCAPFILTGSFRFQRLPLLLFCGVIYACWFLSNMQHAQQQEFAVINLKQAACFLAVNALPRYMFPCSLPKDQAVRALVKKKVLNAFIVKKELIAVMGQQGRNMSLSLSLDPARVLKSNIWDK